MSTSSDIELLSPLAFFRKRDGRPLPVFEEIDGDAMPEPYRGLLVHHGDMTSRLESFYHSSMKLRLLHVDRTGEQYRREVLLCMQDSGHPVEYGAIEIHLPAFPNELREQIIDGRIPLGGLLNHGGFVYSSRPRAFFRIDPDPALCHLFGVETAPAFYGRSNTLLSHDGTELADIVEVLRP
jgi:chorismate-pyruvate lyase